MDWARWSKELELRREEVRNELKRGIKIKASGHKNLDIDTLIDKSWDEMAAVMSAQGQPQITANIDEDKLSLILNRVLAAAGNIPAQKTEESPKESELIDIREVAELSNDLEELEEVETLADAEIEELEELEEEEELDAIDDLEESAEELEEIETLADSEEVEELEELEEEELVAIDDLEDNEEILESDDEGDSIPLAESANLLKELEGIISFVDSENDDSLEVDSFENKKTLSEEEIAKAASEIEFSDMDTQEEDLYRPVEIYSPFDNLLRSEKDDGESSTKEDDDSYAMLEDIDPSYSVSLIHNPFQIGLVDDDLAELEEVDSDENPEQMIDEGNSAELLEEIPEEVMSLAGESVMDDEIIIERNGVNYITDFHISSNGKDIDAAFKDLVDSILNNKD
jgi:hypothetical protein